MDLGLAGKRVLVTGSTAGIGRAAAQQFAREGAEVIVNGRTEARVKEAVQAILRAEPQARVRGVAADVSVAAGVDTLVRAVPDVDVLVNNAGVFEPVPFEQITDEAWMRMFETNVMSGVRLARHHFPRMLARGWGRIVFVSSESALQIPVEMIHYGVSKTAQLAVARGLAERTRGTGVTVNAVLPGPTSSEGVVEFVRQLAQERKIGEQEMERQFFATARPTSLLQRFATPEEAAHLIVYVSSTQASATNGAALRVDGGVVRAIV
ncbi:SDR family NAD(P)-dependent oxidoreductase [Anaeromyxobacter soli]|uniref:SDR family NAD(P)-dependent oxidoreductase n=1 Tax=Anaeromyxobacter soli TaxID=2922725 RepID=UPI001FAE8661|nr:SDR family oxidoreductase [Anaeromyxobacter sp. SG29]